MRIAETTVRRPLYFGTFNFLVKSLLRIGIPFGPMALITVRGRKSGVPRTNPVGLMENRGRYFTIGTFGDSNWCKNLRVAGEAKIGRGRKRRQFWISELRDPEERAGLLKEILAPYLATRMGSQMLKMGYELSKDSAMEDYTREARRHPVFEVKFRSS